MSVAAGPPSSLEPTRSRPRVVWLASIVFLGVIPVLAVIALFVATLQDDTVAIDLGQFYQGAEAILRGDNPYRAGEVVTEWGGWYPYPPLPALTAIPLTVFSFQTAGVIVMASLLAAVLATLWALDVRDWRCYGVALLWPPVLSAIQTGNVTLWLALAAALAWRYRDRTVATAASVGVTLAVKFFLWPLVVWQAATRRYASAVLASAIGAGLLLLSWAAIGFAGMTEYPDLVRRLEEAVGADSYTLYIVGLDLGLPSAVARSIWLGVGLGLLAGVVLLARRGDERRAFVLAIATALALTPIVWLHYFALLLVVVAVAQPRLGLLWFVPLAMVMTPGSGHPSPFETAATLVVATLTVVLALRAAGGAARSIGLGRGLVPASAQAHRA